MSSLGLDHLVINRRTSVVASHEEAGLSAKAPSTTTTLTGGNSYQFKVNTVNYTITIPTDVSYLSLVKTINGDATLQAAKIRVVLVGGDLRFYIESATITLAAGTAADLFAALSAPLGDTKVNAIMLIKFPITGKSSIINAISANFPIFYTGDIIWEIISAAGEEYNQQFSAAIVALSAYHKEDLLTPCKQDDWIYVSTSAACAGNSYATLTWATNY